MNLPTQCQSKTLDICSKNTSSKTFDSFWLTWSLVWFFSNGRLVTNSFLYIFFEDVHLSHTLFHLTLRCRQVKWYCSFLRSKWSHLLKKSYWGNGKLHFLCNEILDTLTSREPLFSAFVWSMIDFLINSGDLTVLKIISSHM